MKKLSIALLSTTLVALSFAPIAEGKFRDFGGGGFRSKPSFSRTYTAPKPTYRPAPSRPTTVYNRTTVVQQNSGGGMFSNIVGTVIGMSLYDWMFSYDDDKQEAEK
ncbi:hypothetical protein GHK50_21150 [Sinorhizobium medicae]|uniref:Transmembrane protein n=1 Tax=Sinorhizobium medicae TaxID=110321 RepID=A0A6G1WUQ9_9HYPH|nr:hypothetical protein [Sinorhizobium medicae]MQW73479.1 hypothetical protein [Sinorhizobium medicae]MQX85574.1 hypothetical protein [Sinorhizobium medicae]